MVVGVPRSGTTWAGEVLGGVCGVTVVSEPDNEGWSGAALGAKRRLGRFPVLAPGETAAAYHRLWAWALAGAPPTTRTRVGDRLVGHLDEPARQRLIGGRGGVAGRLAAVSARPPRRVPTPAAVGAATRVVAKSVHLALSVEWLAAAFDVDVVVLLRHPAGILSSWLELALADADRGLDRSGVVQTRYIEPWSLPRPGPTAFERCAWQLGLLLTALEEAASRHANWHVWTHEALCADPSSEFRRLCAALDLPWSSAVDDRIAASDAAGTGFSTRRRTAGAADAWRERLTDEQVDALRRVLAGFPLRRWAGDGFGAAP